MFPGGIYGPNQPSAGIPPQMLHPGDYAAGLPDNNWPNNMMFGQQEHHLAPGDTQAQEQAPPSHQPFQPQLQQCAPGDYAAVLSDNNWQNNRMLGQQEQRHDPPDESSLDPPDVSL